MALLLVLNWPRRAVKLDRCGSDFRLESTVRCGERRQQEIALCRMK